jgi:hypothetical protein
MSEADHSLPVSGEVENGGTISPLPHMSSWHGAELIEHRVNAYSLCNDAVSAADVIYIYA